ncbi:MAG TPA: SPOR domain-containing protein [Magnetospirillaceae bacterium]|nr:SPOR domain-containing protein [Magnetospirillaceae bacterium]
MPALFIVMAAAMPGICSAWEGSATVGVRGEFPGSGLFAASDSFPRDTEVNVVNLENGKTVTVVVTGGVGNPGIFMLLSPEAARALAMEPGTLTRVRASSPRTITRLPSVPSAREGDPDFNPSLLASRFFAVQAPKAEVPTAPPPAPAAAPAAEAAVVVPPPAPQAPDPTPPAVPAQVEPEAQPDRPEVFAREAAAPSAAPAAAPIVAPEVSMTAEPPQETARVLGIERPSILEAEASGTPALMDPAPAREVVAEAEPLQIAQAAAEEAAPPTPTVVVPPAVAPMPTPATPPPEPVPAATGPRAEPSAPPQAAPVPPATAVLTPGHGRDLNRPPAAPSPTLLIPGRHYIQVGAYRSRSSLDAAAARLSDSFPIVVNEFESGSSTIYRLLVGPIGRDETGITLLKVRELGFREAFLHRASPGDTRVSR